MWSVWVDVFVVYLQFDFPKHPCSHFIDGCCFERISESVLIKKNT